VRVSDLCHRREEAFPIHIYDSETYVCCRPSTLISPLPPVMSSALFAAYTPNNSLLHHPTTTACVRPPRKVPHTDRTPARPTVLLSLLRPFLHSTLPPFPSLSTHKMRFSCLPPRAESVSRTRDKRPPMLLTMVMCC